MSSKVSERHSLETALVKTEPSWSMSRRLTVWYAASVFVLVLSTAIILYWRLAEDFKEADNQALLKRVQMLSTLLREVRHEELRWEVEYEWKDADPPTYIRILDERQKPFLETPGMSELLPAGVFPLPVPLETPILGGRIRGFTGRAFRVAAAALSGPQSNKGWMIHVAMDLDRQEAMFQGLAYVFAAVLGATALISLAVGNRITRTGMRPLQKMVEVTQRIRTSSLGARISKEGVPSELTVLADNFNSMLDRLEESFSRLSRFSADIAHELRTPLGNLRGEAEVALSEPRSASEYQAVLTSSLEEYASLCRIVEGLLFIAMAETSETTLERERFDMIEELRTIVDFFEPIAANKRLIIELQSSGGLWVELDRFLFRRALNNVISNAITYTRSGGAVTITATQKDSTTRVEVMDTGIGIAPEHLSKVFDRFYRVEPARRRSSGGAGLGLSIVRTIMDLHRGSVEIYSRPGHGTRLTLTFPSIRKLN